MEKRINIQHERNHSTAGDPCISKTAHNSRCPLFHSHRLRNVYKKGNKIARNLREAIGSRPKVLLTATPLQNTLMELYGLVTFIDDKIFGGEESFKD
jgi:SNF2-related domain